MLAIASYSTVTRFLFISLVSIHYLFIMVLQYAFHIFHAAVAEIYVISVENLKKLCCRGKYFAVICMIFFSNICFNVETKGRVTHVMFRFLLRFGLVVY